MAITTENWQYTQFHRPGLAAYIAQSFGPQDSPNGFEGHFQIVVTKNEYQEVYTKRFKTLSAACLHINRHYGHWQLTSTKQQTDNGSCSSCAAH